MTILTSMLSSFRSLFQRQPSIRPGRRSSPARKLEAEQASDFFVWFHIEADGEPEPEDAGMRHRFRPSGAAYRGLVALDVTADAGDGIRSATLCLDRSFVSGPEDAFARDLSKGFLAWILDDPAREQAAPLIASIGSPGTAGGPGATAQPLPPVATTDAYAVFTGDLDGAVLNLESALVTLSNEHGRLSITAALHS